MRARLGIKVAREASGRPRKAAFSAGQRGRLSGLEPAPGLTKPPSPRGNKTDNPPAFRQIGPEAAR
ncbi:MAG: hypothetical protein A3E78_12910 [Alphaproteobacteria bacterium RIFCSPHIGHO2_12_FULL_63_12]|nr:MAG: hypothetical protein A3E78_12910 [Alphaproteobacteria bacterium RIFCSPHIGHO2_12_FULL_63_12]